MEQRYLGNYPRERVHMKGYQYLENDFFSLCRTRKIHRLPMLLYIYLRGLYCRFQKPVFTWEDRKTLEHLGITHPTLQKYRRILSEKGLLLYKPGNGLRNPTEYTLIGNVLLPVLKVKNSFTFGEKNLHLPLQKLSPSIIASNERLKKRIGIFQGTTKDERINLQSKGLLWNKERTVSLESGNAWGSVTELAMSYINNRAMNLTKPYIYVWIFDAKKPNEGINSENKRVYIMNK